MKEVSHKRLYKVHDSEKSNQMELKEAYWLTGSGPGSDRKES